MTRSGLAILAIALVGTVRADAQRRDPRPDEGDTMPNARVLLIPANEVLSIARLEADVKDLRILGVYSTDSPAARALATKVGAGLRSAVQPLTRGARSADEFALAISDSLVDKLARANMKRAIVLVADPDLVRPLLREVFRDRVKGSRGDRALEALEPAGTFTIFVRANNTRLLAHRP